MNAPSAAWIHLHLDLGLSIAVDVEVDGHTESVGDSGSQITVSPGWHRVTCEMPGKGGYGRSTIDVLLHPAQVVHVFYAAPRTYYSRGAIGFTPQQRRWAFDWNDTGNWIAIVVVIVLLVFAAFGAI